MPKVIIIPYNQFEGVCQSAMTFAKSCQSDFTFYILPQKTKTNDFDKNMPAGNERFGEIGGKVIIRTSMCPITVGDNSHYVADGKKYHGRLRLKTTKVCNFT